MYLLHSRRAGFTIVELVVTVVVVAILAAVATAAYTTIQRDTATQSLTSELTAYKAAMDGHRSSNNEYPSAGLASYKAASDASVVYRNGDGTNYCVEATSNRYGDIRYHLDTREDSRIKSGACVTPPVAPAVPTIGTITVAGGTITVNWGAVGGATSYDIQYRMNSGSWSSANVTAATRQYTSLALGATYDFQVRSKNATTTLMSNWSSTATRVTLPTPVIVSKSAPYCGNNGGERSWADATTGIQATSTTYTKSYVFEGDAGSTYGNTPKTVTNTGTGTISALSSSTSWRPFDSDSGTFVIYGTGPSGERSLSASWSTPVWPPYNC